MRMPVARHVSCRQDYYCHTTFEFKVTDGAAASACSTTGSDGGSTAAKSVDDGADASTGRIGTVLAGGRYDGLFQQLGGPANVPCFGTTFRTCHMRPCSRSWHSLWM
jgi:histidyl-tRNA synthetase